MLIAHIGKYCKSLCFDTCLHFHSRNNLINSRGAFSVNGELESMSSSPRFGISLYFNDHAKKEEELTDS